MFLSLIHRYSLNTFYFQPACAFPFSDVCYDWLEQTQNNILYKNFHLKLRAKISLDNFVKLSETDRHCSLYSFVLP